MGSSIFWWAPGPLPRGYVSWGNPGSGHGDPSGDPHLPFQEVDEQTLHGHVKVQDPLSWRGSPPSTATLPTPPLSAVLRPPYPTALDTPCLPPPPHLGVPTTGTHAGTSRPLPASRASRSPYVRLGLPLRAASVRAPPWWPGCPVLHPPGTSHPVWSSLVSRPRWGPSGAWWGLSHGCTPSSGTGLDPSGAPGAHAG